MHQFDFTKTTAALDEPVIAIIASSSGEFRPGFDAWIADNFHVWREFMRMADKLWYLRRSKHYSASAIVYAIRLQTALAEVGGEWKINQNHARDMAKLYVKVTPDRAGFFEFRLRADTIKCREAA